MSWNLYFLEFQLKSPLHIGYHKVMHLFRTRYYVPAKPMWGAITAKLTRELKIHDYKKVGNFLNRAIRFGYFYLSDGVDLYIPRYNEDGLKFNSKTKTEFERKFISSLSSAAIDPSSMTAEEGMLHEVEFISPYVMGSDPKPVFLKGLIWVKELTESGISIGDLSNGDFNISCGSSEISFRRLVDNIQVGGERKYGFGLLRLRNISKFNGDDLNTLGFCGIWKEEEGNVMLELTKRSHVWAHVKHHQSLRIKGEVEPLVGRDWNAKRGAGRELKPYGLCWAPGSIVTEDVSFSITDEFGIWRVWRDIA